MICQQLESYHDRQLSAKQHAEFREHLIYCAACQTQLDQLEKIESDLVAIYFLQKEVCHFDNAQNAAVPVNESTSSSSCPSLIPQAKETETRRMDLKRKPRTFPRFSKALCLALATVACLAFALIGFNWYFSDPNSTWAEHRVEIENTNNQEAELVASESVFNPEDSGSLRAVTFEFEGPTIVRHAITTPQFTYIEIYSQFERVDPEAEYPDSLKIDRSTF